MQGDDKRFPELLSHDHIFFVEMDEKIKYTGEKTDSCL